MAKKNSIESIELKPTQEDVCAMRPKSGSMLDSIPCFATVHNKFWFKCVVFLLIFSLDAADLVSDWLLYRDVSATEEGLVYGPPEDYLRYLLLAFSVVGSLTFTFEVINLWWEVFRSDPWLDVDLLQAITVWIEDVPQIAINIAIVACREEAISYFQLVKASVILFGALIRIIVSLVRYCSRKARHDLKCASVNKESKRHVIYRVFIMIGLFLTLGGAITIFMFTQSERNPDGSLNFKIPHSIVEGEYDDEKYFQNVSIYFSHELFDYSNKPNTLHQVNLLRLMTINNIKRLSDDREIKIAFDQLATGGTGNSKVVITVVSLTSGTNDVTCFEIDRTSNKLNNLHVTSAVCSGTLTSPPPYEYTIKFHFTKPSVPKLLFGDIKYNIKLKSTSSNCETPDFLIDNDVTAHADNQRVAAFHYYRNNQEAGHVRHDGQFYHDSELKDISEVWKTGFAYCKSSGSLAPHLDESIPVTC